MSIVRGIDMVEVDLDTRREAFHDSMKMLDRLKALQAGLPMTGELPPRGLDAAISTAEASAYEAALRWNACMKELDRLKAGR